MVMLIAGIGIVTVIVRIAGIGIAIEAEADLGNARSRETAGSATVIEKSRSTSTNASEMAIVRAKRGALLVLVTTLGAVIIVRNVVDATAHAVSATAPSRALKTDEIVRKLTLEIKMLV